MATIDRVRSELRELRKLSHAIDSGVRANNRLERYIKLMSERERESYRIIELRERLNIQKRNTDSFTDKAAELLSKYSKAISKLEDLTERTIATDAFLNGQNYKSVARSVFMSEAGVKKRVQRIYEKISKIIE